jgi:hypothetical protein
MVFLAPGRKAGSVPDTVRPDVRFFQGFQGIFRRVRAASARRRAQRAHLVFVFFALLVTFVS